MAISNNIYAPSETKWGISLESTFGTAIADTGNFEMWEGDIPSVTDRGITRYQEQLNDGTRVPQDVNMYHSEIGGVRIIPFSNVRLRREDAAILLYSALQVMDEGESADFAKVMTIDNTTTQPQFSNDAGLFFTLGLYNPLASFQEKYTSCIIKTLTLSATLFGGDGLLYASGEMISGFASDVTANFNTGTWAYNTKNYVNFGTPTTKQIGGSDIVLYGFDITIDNGATRFGNDSSGNAEGYRTNMAGHVITGNVRCKYDPNVQSLVGNDIAGTGFKIQIATGSGGSAGHMDFTMNECFANGVAKGYPVEEGMILNVPFKAAYDSSGSNSLITATVSDGKDRAWPT